MRLFLLAFLSLFAPAALAQSVQPDAPRSDDGLAVAPPHIATVDGRATLQREGRADEASSGIPLVAGDRLLTEEGRVEIVLGDGSAIAMDRQSTIDWQDDALVRLITGRMLLIVATIEEGTKFIPYRVDTVGGIVQVNAPGEYRLTTLQSQGGYNVELAVVRGDAEFVNDLGRMTVRGGQRSFVSAGAAPSYASPFNSAMWDAFDQWVAERRQLRAGITSPRYLPPELYSYSGVFDRHGAWRHEPGYGYVWFPYVAGTWRPYVHGYWNHINPFGWTWIAHDVWGWPTHHYGRWGVRAGTWFWIPSRRWGPAWVHWAVAPGYVAWCPLGFDNRPLIGINIFNRGDYYRVGPGYYGARGAYDPWFAWNVVPFDRFRGRGPVRPHLVDGRSLGFDVHSRFVMQRLAPLNREPSARAGAVTGVAVPRGTIPTWGSRNLGSGVVRGQSGVDRAPVVPRAVPRQAPQGYGAGRPDGFRSRTPTPPSSTLGPAGPVPTPSPNIVGEPPGRGVARPVPPGFERRSSSPEAVPERYREGQPGDYRGRVPRAGASRDTPSPPSAAPVPESDGGHGVAVPRSRERGAASNPPSAESPRVHRPSDGGDRGYRGRADGGEGRSRGGERAAPPSRSGPPPSSTPNSGGGERSRAVPRGGSGRR